MYITKDTTYLSHATSWLYALCSVKMISKRIFFSRYIQLTINVCTVITGFCTFLPLGYVWKYFIARCVLYADLDVSVSQNMTVKVDVQKSIWGTSSNCNYTTFVSVVAAIHAFIWCWFFLLMKSTLKEENREYYLLLPSILFHGIMFLVVFVSSSIVSAGANSFCHNVGRKLNSRFTCEEAFDMSWDIFSQKTQNNPAIKENVKHSIYKLLLTAKISSWLMTLTILAQCLLTGYKLYKWFLEENPDSNIQKPKAIEPEPGSNNDGFIEDSDSNELSDTGQIHIENVFIHEETGSLIRF